MSWVRLRGPVIQANGRLTYEDDLRSGGLLWFISMNASIRTELADSMVTPGEPGDDWVSRDGNFACGIHPAAQIAIGEQQWVTGFHCLWSVVGWLIVPRWQSISIQANIVRPSVNKVTYGSPQGTPMVQLQIMMIPIKLGNINSTSLESRALLIYTIIFGFSSGYRVKLQCPTSKTFNRPPLL